MTDALRTYQREAVSFLSASGRAILAYPPGTGKTATISDWLGSFDELERTPRFLIVAPNGPVLEHWVAELWRWGSVKGVVGRGTPTRRAASRGVVTADGGALVLNYECCLRDIEALIKIKWDAVVFDESHRLKNRKALVLKAATKLTRRSGRLALVTGTPLLNSADEVWTSLHMCDPKRHTSFVRWATLLFECVEVQRGYRVKVVNGKPRSVKNMILEVGEMKPGSAAVIRKQLEPYLIKRPLAELLPDLPPVTETYLTVELSGAERKMYDSMRSHFWMEHDGDVTTALHKISQSLRLRQLASDWTAFAENAELGAKGKAAVELIEDLAPDQVLVFCAFRHTVDALVAAMHGEAIPFHGGHSAEGRAKALDDFRHGRRRVLVGTIATLGEGIDGLQVARNCIMVDRDWTPARNEQAIGRLRRSGQKSAVNVMHLIANDTIDSTVSDALRRKASVIDAILNRETGNHAVHRPGRSGRARAAQ